MSSLNIRKVVIDDDKARNLSFTKRILSRLASEPSYGTGYTGSKETLHLLSHKGEFLKPCPGTREYICCGYQILNVATGCPLNCSYCILQSYFSYSDLAVFVNLEEAIDQVFRLIDGQPHRIFRIGTGEFTDSLALDPLVFWTDLLLSRFSKTKNAVLELKTKTINIGGLLSSQQRDRIIVSWSLNSPFIASREEHKAPSIRKRLEAARECQREGFVLSFHFDPILVHPNWRDEYRKTLEMMDKYIDPKGIIWISLGSFRFMPDLKNIIRRFHPKSSVLDGEFIVGLDGKCRYFRPIRVELYSYIRELLEAWSDDISLYLCMESDDVWRESMGWSPRNNQGLSDYLDSRVVEVFG
ncbi:MAG: radical SAM protein [Desulfatiglans sp.]|nr:radical SAM protein [Desulfatiglans sp.]